MSVVNKNVLCVAAHPDDEVLGAGGTLARHSTARDTVHVCMLADGVLSRDEAEMKQAKARREQAAAAVEALGATHSTHAFPDNQFDSLPLLEIVKTIEAEIAEHTPEIIYTHHPGDLNIDHQLTARATMTAARPLGGSPVRRILGYEVLSSTEWGMPTDGDTFTPTVFVDIRAQLETKLAAMRAYTTELREPPHPRCEQAIRALAQLRGSTAGVPAAESFVLLREIDRDAQR